MHALWGLRVAPRIRHPNAAGTETVLETYLRAGFSSRY